MTGWLTPFLFRGLKFRLHTQGFGLQVYDPSDKKWYGTEFWYPRTLKELGAEVPDIGKWIDRSYFGSIRFPEPPIPSSNPSVKGEQAGMLGVPGKVHVQKRPYEVGQQELEDYGKYRRQMLIDYDKKYSLEQLKEMCRAKGFSVSGDKKTLIGRLI